MSPSQILLGALERARAGPGMGLTRLRGVRTLHRLADRALSRVESVVAGREPEIRALGFRIAIDPGDRQVAAQLLRTGTYEPVETRMFADAIRPGMTVVDIGANLGVYTLIAARAVGSTGAVFAFEPSPTSAGLLRRSIGLNSLGNVVVEEAAVADVSGMADLFLVAGHPALASLNSANARDSTTSLTARCITLDDYFADIRVDVLKIDAQGAESAIARGGRHVLERDRPVVFAEIWVAGLREMGSDSREFLRLFTELRYAISTVDRDGDRLSLDEATALAESTGGFDVILRPDHRPPARRTPARRPR